MKTLAKTTLVMMLILSFTAFAWAQETLWNELNAKLVTLYQQGQYSEAAKIAEEALSVAEKTFGPDHPDVATVLGNMAQFYEKIGKKDEARRFEEQAKKIRLKNQ